MSKETILKEDAFLVSETDAKGIIQFANDDFCKVAEFSVEELIGKPHNVVRHPDMPKAAFKDLWETVKRGEVWTGYVKNATRSGGYYWVYATVFNK
jgi:aerotaxis receptor